MTTGFDLLEQQFAPHLIGDRTGSTAMLAWFLENAWREETDEVESALCDGSNDKGIDAIVADTDAREITVFQGKRRQTAGRTQGTRICSAFVGSLRTFEAQRASMICWTHLQIASSSYSSSA